MKAVNCLSGSGKTEQLIVDIKNLLAKGILPEKICVILLSKSHGEVLEKELADFGIKINSLQNLANEIFRKNPNNEEISTFSNDNSAINLLQKLIEINTKGTDLENLGKVNAFAREIYNLIGVLKSHKITDFNTLKNACTASDIGQKEAERLNIIAKIYGEYAKILEKNNFADFRDVILSDIQALKDLQTLKNEISYKYEYIFVEGAENITSIQLELLKAITDESKINLYGDKNAQIETFMGANAFNPQDLNPKENHSVPKDIYERALFIINSQNEISTKNENITYTSLTDTEEEIDFIANEIKNSNSCKMSDIAILLRDNSLKQNISELLAEKNIPVNGEASNKDFQYFKFKITNIFSIFDIMQTLNVENFSFDSFKIAEIKAKEDKKSIELKILAEQLNLFYHSIISEKIARPYNLNTLKFLQEKEKETFLPCTVFKHFYQISQPDKNHLETVNEQIKKLYKLHKENRILELISEIADLKGNSGKNFSRTYHLFLAKFMTQAEEINQVFLKTKSDLDELVQNSEQKIEKPNLNLQIINDLFNISVKEVQDDEKINVLTIFEASGRNFKKVFIPNLVDEYFPKATKTTSFISKSADEKISEELRKSGTKDFSHLIDTKDDDLKGECSLMYTAMTAATEKVILTTHKYCNGKEVLPSLFFEKLAAADNFEPQQMPEKEDVSEEILQEKEEEKPENIEQSPILEKNEKLRLSATQINNFQKCPRMFYYSKLLGMKSKSTFSINFGTAVHEIFRTAYTHHLSKMNSKENIKTTLKEIGEILFDSVKDENSLQKAIDAGFEYIENSDFSNDKKGEKKSDILNQLREMSLFDLEIMKKEYFDTLDCLSKTVKILGLKRTNSGDYYKKGIRDEGEQDFYNKIPLDAKCEKQFKFSLPKEYGMENVEFNGFIDSFIEYENGWTLYDYKTGGEETNLFKQLTKETNELFQNQTTEADAKDLFAEFKHQIILYYFACLYDEVLKNEEYSKVNELGYFYIRPEYKNKGSVEEVVPASLIDELKQEIIENLKKYVVTPIYNADKFSAAPIKKDTCERCSFNEICGLENEEGEE